MCKHENYAMKWLFFIFNVDKFARAAPATPATNIRDSEGHTILYSVHNGVVIVSGV